jgi:hypothetical protein
MAIDCLSCACTRVSLHRVHLAHVDFRTFVDTLAPASRTSTVSRTTQGYYGPTIVLTDSSGNNATTTNIGFSIAGDNTMGGCEFFPPSSIFHTRVDTLPVDTSPAAPIPESFRSAQVHPFFGAGGPSGGALPNGWALLARPL